MDAAKKVRGKPYLATRVAKKRQEPRNMPLPSKLSRLALAALVVPTVVWLEYAANLIAPPSAAGRLAAARKFDHPGPEPAREVYRLADRHAEAIGLYQGVSTAFPGTYEAQRADARVRALSRGE